jgi:hypothetical protein
MIPRSGPRNLLAAALIALAPGAAVAQADPTGPTEGALFLLLPVGAQSVSLGRAMTWVESAEGAFWNPAGLASLGRSQFVVFRGDDVAGTSTAFSAFWSSPAAGTLGASYYLLDAGEIEQRDDLGNPSGYITIRNHLGVVSAATRLASTFSAGLNLKVIRYQYSCRGICPDEGTTATSYAIDAGVQSVPLERLRVGAMVAHLGPSLQVVNAEQADPLPWRIRVATAYDVLSAIAETDQLRGWVAVEYEDRLRELGSASVYLGTEVVAGQADALAIRAGYVWSELDQEDGARVGLGLTYERFDLSIAKALTVSTLSPETEPVHVTFSIAF